MSGPIEGWYDDGQGSMRWWDGQRWTHDVQARAPLGPAPDTPAPPGIPPPPPGIPPPPPGSKAPLSSPPAGGLAIDARTIELDSPAAGESTPRNWKVPLFVAGGVAVVAVVVVVTATLIARNAPSSIPDSDSGVGVVCWDGSYEDFTDECPVFEGEAALRYAFALEDSPSGETAQCDPMDPADYVPAGATAVLSCTWLDLPGLTVYLASYSSTNAARSAWDTYYAGVVPFDWVVADERVGSGWDGQGTSPSGDTYWSTGTLYDDLPVGVEYYAESPQGSPASIDAAWERVITLGTDSVDEIVGSA